MVVLKDNLKVFTVIKWRNSIKVILKHSLFQIKEIIDRLDHKNLDIDVDYFRDVIR
jgi:hypothetical protein